MKLKERHITCVRILKEISQGNNSLVKASLPPKNYKSPEKRGNSSGSVNNNKNIDKLIDLIKDKLSKKIINTKNILV